MVVLAFDPDRETAVQGRQADPVFRAQDRQELGPYAAEKSLDLALGKSRQLHSARTVRAGSFV